MKKQTLKTKIMLSLSKATVKNLNGGIIKGPVSIVGLSKLPDGWCFTYEASECHCGSQQAGCTK